MPILHPKIRRMIQYAIILFSIWLLPAMFTGLSFVFLNFFDLRLFLAEILLLFIFFFVYLVLIVLCRPLSFANQIEIKRWLYGMQKRHLDLNRSLYFSMGVIVALFLLWFLLYQLKISWQPAINLPMKWLILGISIVGSSLFLIIHTDWFIYVSLGRSYALEHLEFLFKNELLRVKREKDKIEIGYSNPCAVVNGICTKCIIIDSPRSCFFAYPFNEEYTKRMDLLGKAMRSKNFIVNDAREDFTGQILICKLCKKILSSQIFVCDTSIPNVNVFLEMGFAAGVKKTIIMIFDKEKKNLLLENTIFRDIIKFSYKDTEEMDYAAQQIEAVYLGQSIDSMITSPPPLGGKEFKGFEIPTALILTPEILTSLHDNNKTKEHLDKIVESIEIFLETSNVIVSGKDILKKSSEHPINALFHAINNVSLVFAVLLSDNEKESENINASICFFMGYALALGKKTLIFHEEPCKKPAIDLYGLSDSFRDTGHLNQILCGIDSKSLFIQNQKHPPPF